MTGLVNVNRSSNVTLTDTSPVLRRLFEARGPINREIGYQVETMVRRFFLRHRRDVIQQLPTPGLRRAFRNHGWGTFSVFPNYTIDGEAARRRLWYERPSLGIGDIEGRVRTRNEALIVQEFGGTITAKSRRYLATPAGKFQRMSQTRRRELGLLSPEQYNEKHPDKPLVFIPAGSGLRGLRNKARLSGNAPGYLARPITTSTGKERLEVVFVLRKSVDIRPKLNLERVWNSLGSYRSEKVQEHIGRAITAIGAQARNLGNIAGVRNA